MNKPDASKDFKPVPPGGASGKRRARATPKGRQLDPQSVKDIRGLLGEAPLLLTGFSTIGAFAIITLVLLGKWLGLVAFGTGFVVLAGLAQCLVVRATADYWPPDPATADDPNVRIQRQMMLFLPLISIVYGGFLPAGLFIYWIVATIFSIVQQYLIVGWGAMFPLFGRTPAFAVDHTPRYPVAMPPPPEPGKRAAILTDADKKTTATKTIRPRERGRQGRRGRRR